MPEKRWLFAPLITDAAHAALTLYPPVVAQLLFNRGLVAGAEADRFFAGQLAHSDDPNQLTDLPATVARLQTAIRHQERIAVYGDYDTDGVTATAVLVQVLTALGAEVMPYIPNRYDEGYGLNVEALRKLKNEHGVRVVVSVDCGIRSVVEADEARALGLDLIITDHHSPGPELPRAFAVVNPKRADDGYPDKGLAGVGIAYKIAQGLIRPLATKPLNGSDVLDLVALGTVADLAPLSGENRLLVRNGLKVINTNLRREGLKALLVVSRLTPGNIDASNIGFALGPRLNAAGRLESALAAYDLLTTSDVFKAGQWAMQLEAQNRERQDLTRAAHARAREIALAAAPDAPLLFAADESFKDGIVGLAAARLTEEFYRPAVVATRQGNTIKGSARSIREFHITEAFDQCQALLLRHGGHAAAAGFTALATLEDTLANALRAIAAEKLSGLDLRPALRIDAEIPVEEINGELLRWVQQFEPCGYGNPAPLFCSRGVKVAHARPVGAEAKHIKLTLGAGNATLEAIAFNQGEWLNRLPARIDLAYHLEMNEWNGEKRLQLNVRDLRAAE